MDFLFGLGWLIIFPNPRFVGAIFAAELAVNIMVARSGVMFCRV